MTKITHSSPITLQRSVPLSIVGILILIAVVFLLNFRLFVTSGASMEPTYAPGTFLLASRLCGEPEVGDVVFLTNNNKICMKRVAFIAGEDVSLAGYNGYWGSSIIPEGYVFVLGDNTENSRDSRDPNFGLVAISDIWGKPITQRKKQ